MLKNLFIAARIFAFVNLLFVPSIAVLIGVALISGERWWFSFVGIPALIANAWVVFSSFGRKRVWSQIVRMAGFPASAGQSGVRIAPLGKG